MREFTGSHDQRKRTKYARDLRYHIEMLVNQFGMMTVNLCKYNFQLFFFLIAYKMTWFPNIWKYKNRYFRNEELAKYYSIEPPNSEEFYSDCIS